jgi:hypothetical protein
MVAVENSDFQGQCIVVGCYSSNNGLMSRIIIEFHVRKILICVKSMNVLPNLVIKYL